MSAACLQPVRGIRQGKLYMFPQTKVQRIPLPDGDRGIKVTIDWMHTASSEGARDPQIRQLALRITQGVANKDYAGEMAAVYAWVKSNIRFRGEWDETVQAPEVTLRFGAGDCDDHSVLVCALLGALGYRCRFKTVAVRGERDFTHVYAEALNPGSGQWVALDTTVDQAAPGWEPPERSRERSWNALSGWTPRARPTFGRYGRMGDAVGQTAADVNAAMPLFNAIADVNVADYNSARYGRPLTPVAALDYGPGNVSFSTAPPAWLVPVVVLGGLGIVAMILRPRRGR